MNASVFDPQSFLDAQLTEPTEKRPPLPVGDYRAVVGEVSARQWTGKADPTKTGIAWDIPLTLEIPTEVQSAMGVTISTLNVTDSIMLDLTAQGTIDNGVGKNRRLRSYREACNMNKPGDVFSAKKMQGQIILVKIKHDMWEDNILEKVAGVAKA